MASRIHISMRGYTNCERTYTESPITITSFVEFHGDEKAHKFYIIIESVLNTMMSI